MSVNNDKSSGKPNENNSGKTSANATGSGTNATTSSAAATSSSASTSTSTSSSSATAAASVSSGSEKVCDILRKERLTRRITIETIAKDLKLNADYLKALEEGDFANLPAAPYVRVYIKSLTKYLSLDSEKIMKQFYEEQGLLSEEKEANKIDITVQKQEKNPTAIVAAVLVVILAVFAFIANQRGWLSAQPDANDFAPPPVVEETKGVEVETDFDADEDSVLAITNAPHDTGAAAAKAPPRP